MNANSTVPACSSSDPDTKRAQSAYKQSSSPLNADIWKTVEEYLPLLKSIVARMRIYFPETVDGDDIYSVGLTGLISAVNNFNPAKGKSFGNYAKIRIKGTLLDELRRLDSLSRDDRAHAKKYQHSVLELEQKIGRPATKDEICKELEISVKEFEHLSHLRSPVHVPLDMPLLNGSDEGPTLAEMISDPTEQNSRDYAENSELIEMLKSCIHELDETPQKVLAMYYLDGLRLVEIAEVFSLSESRICQIHSKALTQLRALLFRKTSQETSRTVPC